MKIEWKMFKASYPFICDSCNAGLWEKRTMCENCGKTHTIRKTTKKDYKAEMKRRK